MFGLDQCMVYTPVVFAEVLSTNFHDFLLSIFVNSAAGFDGAKNGQLLFCSRDPTTNSETTNQNFHDFLTPKLRQVLPCLFDFCHYFFVQCDC